MNGPDAEWICDRITDERITQLNALAAGRPALAADRAAEIDRLLDAYGHLLAGVSLREGDAPAA